MSKCTMFGQFQINRVVPAPDKERSRRGITQPRASESRRTCVTRPVSSSSKSEFRTGMSTLRLRTQESHLFCEISIHTKKHNEFAVANCSCGWTTSWIVTAFLGRCSRAASWSHVFFVVLVVEDLPDKTVFSSNHHIGGTI